jgi:hypothetical protein
MCEFLCQPAIVGEQNQPLTLAVESTYRKHASRFIRNEIDNPHPARWISMCANHTFRLVDHVVDLSRLHQRHPIHANCLFFEINFGPQRRDDLLIDFHPALEDQLLALPPTGNTRRRNYFLQSLWTGSRCGRFSALSIAPGRRLPSLLRFSHRFDPIRLKGTAWLIFADQSSADRGDYDKRTVRLFPAASSVKGGKPGEHMQIKDLRQSCTEGQ